MLLRPVSQETCVAQILIIQRVLWIGLECIKMRAMVYPWPVCIFVIGRQEVFYAEK